MINTLEDWQDYRFEVLFEDEHLVAINKPSGILVHRTGISEDKISIIELLSEQIGTRPMPVHRLDRGTSGVLIFGKNSEIVSLVSQQWTEKTVLKKYVAIVRGHAPEAGTIDYALASDPKKPKLPAVTHFKKIGQSEIEAAIGLRYPTARFSLLEATPETGRMHQIRKHFAHIHYPIINDRLGDINQNKYFKEVFGIRRLLLHASAMEFEHPISGERMRLEAGLDEAFRAGLKVTELGDFGF